MIKTYFPFLSTWLYKILFTYFKKRVKIEVQKAKQKQKKSLLHNFLTKLGEIIC